MKKLLSLLMLVLFGGIVFAAVLITFTDNVDTMKLLQKGFYWFAFPLVGICILFGMKDLFKQ